MVDRKAPRYLRNVPAARRAWRDLWALLEENGLGEELYEPMVSIIATELGLAEEASNAIFRPIDPETGRRVKRTLEQYLRGRNSQTSQELTVMRDSLKQAAKLIAGFPTSPAAEKQIGNNRGKNEESPMMEYIRTMNDRLKRRTS
jgi:hypothetical protein